MKIKDPECLLLALHELGWTADKLEVHAEPQPLYGFQGDERAQRAHVIIRRKHISSLANDVGFVFKADGTCETLISDYDQGTFDRFWVRRLVQVAGVNAALKEAQRQGHRAVRRTHPKTGNPQVVVTGRW